MSMFLFSVIYVVSSWGTEQVEIKTLNDGVTDLKCSQNAIVQWRPRMEQALVTMAPGSAPGSGTAVPGEEKSPGFLWPSTDLGTIPLETPGFCHFWRL